MKIRNHRIFLLFLFICIFCLTYFYIKYTVNAQYPLNNNYYYEYTTQSVVPSYFFDNMYSNNYSWLKNQYFGKETAIPTFQINDWTVQPAFGNTVFSISTEGNAFTVYGTYFSAHTQSGINFNRTLSMDNSLFSMPIQTNYQNIRGQASFTSPLNYYIRLILEFSPVLHGPLLNY